MTEPRHCDEFIDDAAAPEVLRAFLRYARAPGHGFGLGAKPTLWATIKEPADPFVAALVGKPVRVVMASRFGDVGINTNGAETGYEKRVPVEWLTDFRAER